MNNYALPGSLWSLRTRYASSYASQTFIEYLAGVEVVALERPPTEGLLDGILAQASRSVHGQHHQFRLMRGEQLFEPRLMPFEFSEWFMSRMEVAETLPALYSGASPALWRAAPSEVLCSWKRLALAATGETAGATRIDLTTSSWSDWFSRGRHDISLLAAQPENNLIDIVTLTDARQEAVEHFSQSPPVNGFHECPTPSVVQRYLATLEEALTRGWRLRDSKVAYLCLTADGVGSGRDTLPLAPSVLSVWLMARPEVQALMGGLSGSDIPGLAYIPHGALAVPCWLENRLTHRYATRDAHQLAQETAEYLLDGDASLVDVYLSYEGWSEWFDGALQTVTAVVNNRSTGRLSLLLLDEND